MQKLFLAALALGAAFALQAQDSNTIVTDNLGQLMSPQTVGKNTVQIEGGYSYLSHQMDLSEYTFSSKSNMGILKVRYGFLRRFEVSAEYEGLKFDSQSKFTNHDPRNLDSYESNYQFRLKANILKGNELSPSLGAGISYDTGEYTDQVKLNVALGSELTNKLMARVELGYIYDNEFEFGLHLEYAIKPNFLVFAEYFQTSWYSGFTEKHLYNFPGIDVGLGYNLSQNTQFNVFGTYALQNSLYNNPTDQETQYSININFATRINWGNSKN